MYVPCFDNDIANSFDFRDLESACIVIFISDKISNVCSGSVFLCRAVDVFKPSFVEKIILATVYRQMRKVEEVV